jgi:hypothetical protein
VSDASTAILGNLMGSTPPEILVESALQFPAFIFETASSDRFVDVKSQLGISPNGGSAGVDGVVADFTGDLRNDVFVVRRSINTQLVQVASDELRARMNASAKRPYLRSGRAADRFLPRLHGDPDIARGCGWDRDRSRWFSTCRTAVDGVATHAAGTDLGSTWDVSRRARGGSPRAGLARWTGSLVRRSMRRRSGSPVPGAKPDF